jgi:hypothetical protein
MSVKISKRAARFSAERVMPMLRCGLYALLFITFSPSAAVPDDLYSATVELSDSSQKARYAAFDSALAQVLVKVTGRTSASNDIRQQLFPDSHRLVQRYRKIPPDQVYAAFDAGAIRRGLDAAGQPVWGGNRPLVAVWLAIDTGSGQRYLLSDGSGDSGGQLDLLRTDLLESASERGLPVVLPLLDASDRAQIGVADVWGGFLDRVNSASRRYGAEALLVGRTTDISSSSSNVRWTLSYAGQQSTWEGGIASGPARTADILARQFATTAGSEGRLRLSVSGIDSIDAYGQLRNYLQNLDIVESAGVAMVEADRVNFELVVRGDAARLERVLTASRWLNIVGSSGLESSTLQPALSYSWAAAP